jgi:hypothetical protein
MPAPDEYMNAPIAPEWTMADIRESIHGVDITIDQTGKLWVNVDGRCALRIGLVTHLDMEVKAPFRLVKTHTYAVTEIFEMRLADGH